MRRSRSRSPLLTIGAGALALAGCDGSHSSSTASMTATAPANPTPPAAAMPPPATTTPTAFQAAATALVSNTAAGATITLNAANVATGDSSTYTFPTPMNATPDASLSAAWGVAFGPATPVWVNANATNVSLLFDGTGAPISSLPSVSVPGGPTGIVANIVTTNCQSSAPTSSCVANTGFEVGGAPAKFIFDSLNGGVYAWASGAAATQMATGPANSQYTGLAIFTQSSGQTFLLAANFGTGNVDVYNSSFQFDSSNAAFPGAFKDPNLPAGYAPFGIQQVGDQIVVTYAKQPSSPGPEVDGAGNGVVDVFDATGKIVATIVSAGGVLNAPWGVALAPQGAGAVSGDLLIGDFGDGRIYVFNPTTFAMLGMLTNANGSALQIPGLWGMAFGNGAESQSAGALYYAAQPDHKSAGLYGELTFSGTTQTPPPAAASSTGY